MAGVTDHLTAKVSDRNLRYMPPIPATYAGRKDGEVEVHQSSSAEQPSVWLNITNGFGTVGTAHLATSDARRLGEQLVALADDIDRDWHG